MNWNLEQDYEDVAEADFIPWNLLKGKTIFITGATGLIGSSLINTLLYVNEKKDLQIRILALVRDLEKALQKFKGQGFDHLSKDNTLRFIVGSVEEIPKINDSIDYIIHGASQTASKEFINHAVETICTSVLGTINTLELAKRKNLKGYVYLSSMEMYGYPAKGHIVLEEESGSLSPLDIRNSYPISKQMCEALCCAYAGEYAIPTKIARLTQTFGPGVHYNDTRIFAYFARCVVEKKNIVLKTKGETERCYLYTADAVAAILTILLKGESGQAYNCANEKTYCSIVEVAQKIANEAGISVTYQIEDETKNGFPKTLYMHLGTEKLRTLGWKPIRKGGGIQLVEIYKRMITGYEQEYR